MRWLWIGCGLGLTAMAACGGKDDHPKTVPPVGVGGKFNPAGGSTSAGAGGTAGTAGKSTNGGKGGGGGTDTGEGGSGGMNDLAPVVTIVSPEELLDPSDGAVIIANENDAASEKVKVTCRATPSTDPDATAIDASSVVVSVLVPNPKAGGDPLVALTQVPGVPTTGSDYEAVLPISLVDNGSVYFRCTASDKSRPPHQGQAQISTLVDRGPTITVVAPAAGESRPVVGATHFEFDVAAFPVWNQDDAGAAVSVVTLNVAGVDINGLVADKKRPGTYTAEVDFSDGLLFPQTPSGEVTATITATDARRPLAATRTKSYVFKLDGSGPVVAITSPGDKTVVGGPKRTVVRFTVKDDGSGVDDGTVLVKLNNTDYRYSQTDPNWTRSVTSATETTYGFAFDNTNFTGSAVQVTVNALAQDKAGNLGQAGSLVLFLDNWSPLVSLDTPNARIVHQNSSKQNVCSASFDPLGPKAANDASIVQRLAYFRALIWERTNGVDSSDVVYYAGVDALTPHLYVQTDPTKPILIDTNGDKICDSISPEVRAKTSIELKSIPPTGAGDTNPVVDYAESPSINGSACVTEIVEIKNLCLEQASDMEFVLGQPMAINASSLRQPAVWAPRVGASDTFECTGGKWEVGNVASEGWVCIAAEASDKVGNTGVSAPLRVCFDDETTATTHPTCASTLSVPPSCTDGCTPPSYAVIPNSIVYY